MSFPRPPKRSLDDAHDEHANKRSQPYTDGFSPALPFAINNDLKIEVLADVWRAIPSMSESRYFKDLAFVWNQAEIDDSNIEDMHEQWFECRKHGLIEPLWASRKMATDTTTRTTPIEQSFRIIATLSKICFRAKRNRQADLYRDVSCLQIDYIIFMVLWCHTWDIMEDIDQHFPNYTEIFAELAHNIKSEMPGVTEDPQMSILNPSDLFPPGPVPSNPAPSSPTPSNSIPKSSIPSNTVPKNTIPHAIRALIEQMRVKPRLREDLDRVVGYEIANQWNIAKSNVYAGEPGTAANPVPSRILLHGVPGTGKSTTVRLTASGTTLITLYEVRLASLLARFKGNGEIFAEALFTIATENSPAMIYIDEVDGPFGTNAEPGVATQLTRFLTLWSEFQSPGVTIFGATNEPWAIPQALIRQFTKICHVARPSPEHAVSILRQKIKAIIKCHSLKADEIEELGRRMSGFTGRDIDNAVKQAWADCYVRLRLQAGSHEYYREFPFEGKIFTVACLLGDIGAISLEEAPLNVTIEPGPCTFEDLNPGMWKAQIVDMQWDEAETRHIEWAQDPRGVEDYDT